MKKLFAAAAVACALLVVAAAGAAPATRHAKQDVAARHADNGHKGSHAKHAAKAKHSAKAKRAPKKPAHPKTVAAVPPINWGVADDASKYADDGGAWFYGQLAGANLTENRWTLAWNPSNPTAITELPFVQRAAPVAQAAGIHVVIALYAGDNGTSNPNAKDHDADAFCAWAGIVATTLKVWGIHDYIVWNEPNTAKYFAPQKDAAGNDIAAGPFEALMAKCYDSIHAADADANVIGMGLSPRASQIKTSNAPLSFLRDVGDAYRASGRTAPIMDQLALHPYPVAAGTGEPSRGYTSTPDAFGPPDLDRVKQAVYDAFNGTGQPTTLNGLTFRLDEFGWQTDTSGLPQYTGDENAKPPGLPNPVDEATQAQYLNIAATQYYACDPTVTDVELFLLVDEANRAGWQSGLETAGGKGVSVPKQAYGAMAPVFAQGRAACAAGTHTWTPSGSSTGSGSSGKGSGSSGKGSSGKGSGATGKKAAGKRSGACTKKTKLKAGYVCKIAKGKKSGKVTKKPRKKVTRKK